VTFEVSLNALSSDADKWDETAHTLAQASADASGMVVEATCFSFVGREAHDAYEKARAYIEGFLRDGGTEASGAAAVLREVRAEYENADQRAADRFAKDWKWS
jgi:hypothetical protein